MKRATAEAVACGRYMPKKPTKWGFKVIQMRFSVIGWGVKSHSWACSQVRALCCSKIGYLWSFEVYQGKRQAAAERDIGAAVVMRLTKHLPPGTCVTCDRFFTTLQLAMWLIDVGKWLIGTVMPAKVDNIPEELNYGKSGSGLKRGSSAARYMTYKGVAIWFTAWMDTKPVYLLHTVFSGGSFAGYVTVLKQKSHRQQHCEVCGWGYRCNTMCEECDLPLCLKPREERNETTRNCWALYHDPAIPDYTIYRLSKSKKSKKKRKTME